MDIDIMGTIWADKRIRVSQERINAKQILKVGTSTAVWVHGQETRLAKVNGVFYGQIEDDVEW